MVKKLEYPIDRIHQNLALRKDKVVVAYYRIPNTQSLLQIVIRKIVTKRK